MTIYCHLLLQISRSLRHDASSEVGGLHERDFMQQRVLGWQLLRKRSLLSLPSVVALKAEGLLAFFYAMKGPD